MEAAAAFLAVRPRSLAEVSRRLRHLGYPPALVETVVERFAEMGYLDDEAFARAWLESRDRARPRGDSALRRELLGKGVAAPLVAQLLEARTEDPEAGETQAARRLLERRRSSLSREPDPRRMSRRACELLLRNGFSYETARAAVRDVLLDNASDPDPET